MSVDNRFSGDPIPKDGISTYGQTNMNDKLLATDALEPEEDQRYKNANKIDSSALETLSTDDQELVKNHFMRIDRANMGINVHLPSFGEGHLQGHAVEQYLQAQKDIKWNADYAAYKERRDAARAAREASGESQEGEQPSKGRFTSTQGKEAEENFKTPDDFIKHFDTMQKAFAKRLAGFLEGLSAGGNLPEAAQNLLPNLQPNVVSIGDGQNFRNEVDRRENEYTLALKEGAFNDPEKRAELTGMMQESIDGVQAKINQLNRSRMPAEQKNALVENLNYELQAEIKFLNKLTNSSPARHQSQQAGQAAGVDPLAEASSPVVSNTQSQQTGGIGMDTLVSMATNPENQRSAGMVVLNALPGGSSMAAIAALAGNEGVQESLRTAIEGFKTSKTSKDIQTSDTVSDVVQNAGKSGNTQVAPEAAAIVAQTTQANAPKTR